MSNPWIAIAIKMIATALAVTIASTVAESAGPIWGALAASLPVSAGPAYVFLALAHDAAFVARSAMSSFAANAATIVFLAAYVRLSARLPGPSALIAAVIIWAVMAACINRYGPGLASALMLNVVAFTGGVFITRHAASSRGASPVASRGRLDLPFRALVVAVFVAGVVALGTIAGPSATGTLAAFPIVFVVMIAVLRSRLGQQACGTLAATALRAMGGFGLMLLVISVAVEPVGIPIALSLALATTLAWSALLLCLRRHPLHN